MKQIIKILGTGCPKCKTTTSLVEQVVAENNIDAEVIKIEDIMEIMQYNVMSTPAIVVNDQILVKGRVPSKDEVLKILQDNKMDDSSDSSCCSSDKCC